MRIQTAVIVLCAICIMPTVAATAADAPTSKPAAPATTRAAAPAIITLTPAAAAEIKKIVQQQGLDVKRTYLQVGVKGGAAVRLRYVLDLNEEKPAADDEVFDSQGVRVRVDQKSALYLNGTTIDFVDNDDGKGFVFKNPNAVEDSKKK